MINKLFIIAKNTFIEALRQPIYAVIIISAILLFVISPSVSLYTLDEDIKFLRELGLSTLFISGLFIAVFSATGAITEEIENRTITTVLTKPLPRPVFILGKFLGITAAVSLAHYIGTIALFFIVRHGVLESAADTHDWTVITAAAVTAILALLLSALLNYVYDWNFPATAVILTAILATASMVFLFFVDREWKFNPQGNSFEMFELAASALLWLALIVLVSLAITFSTRFNIVITLTMCIGIFMLGLISDYTFGRFADVNIFAKIAYYAAPNLQVFWVTDAIIEGAAITGSYIVKASTYAFLYTVGILSLATALFQHKQVG